MSLRAIYKAWTHRASSECPVYVSEYTCANAVGVAVKAGWYLVSDSCGKDSAVSLAYPSDNLVALGDGDVSIGWGWTNDCV